MKALKIINIILAGAIVLLCLIGGRLIVDWQVKGDLEAELWQGDSQMAAVDTERFVEVLPSQDDLFRVIDECVQIFQSEEVAIRSYQLEEIAADGNLAELNYALIRFRLQGAWTGIERGVSKIEGIPNQGIQVKEALISQDRGEILFKIYFFTELNRP